MTLKGATKFDKGKHQHKKSKKMRHPGLARMPPVLRASLETEARLKFYNPSGEATLRHPELWPANRLRAVNIC